MLLELREDAIIDFFKGELKGIAFVPEADHPDIAQHLDILSDSEKKRYEKTKAARWVWRYFIEKSLSDITNNLRGYDELCHYFDEFVDYENLLFSLDKNHRDHVIHSVWVMLLGLYLRKKSHSLTNMLYSHIVICPIPETEEMKKDVNETIDIIKKHETSLWCLIALTHDLGYPIEKTKKANETMANMVSNFGFLEQRDFQYNFTIVHQTAISELLNITSSVVMWLSPQGFKVGSQPGIRLDFAKSFERLEHGIMSAYLIQMHIDYICESLPIMLGIPEVFSPKHESAAKQAIIIQWLRAISSHTNNNVYFLQVNSMGALLLLCDELDEFSRYSHSIKSNEWVSVGCRTEFTCTKNSLGVTYTFDNKEIGDDMESFFEMKVAKLYNRFELEDGNIKQFSITCKDVRKAQPVSFIYEKTLSKNPKGVVKRTPGSSYNDIREYLNGTVNLSP